MDLFEHKKQELLKKNAPLADRMRPRTLDEFIGQHHIVGPGRLLRRAIQIDQLSSLIFFGPPGSGKTTLARIIANTTKAHFISINAVLAGIADIRQALKEASGMLGEFGKRTILFIDEVHRFNKAQQDALLPHVENGTIILIGATTENPYFEVNKALVSRSRIFQLKNLDTTDLKQIALQAVNNKERGYGTKTIILTDDALNHLAEVANGDARAVLNGLELAIETTTADENGITHINRTIIEDSIQKRAVLYDKDGDSHYDTISAFIKSIRGSDPDASLYWMAKMLYAGEDPRFIFRRLLIVASEDIGLADPHALHVVVSAAQAFEYVGLPEGRFHLAQACLYLAVAPKSNSLFSFFEALRSVEQESLDDVPDHLKDSSRDKNGLGHGANYLYPHAFRDHWVAQQYLPKQLQGRMFYQPSDQGFEHEIASVVSRKREAQIEAMTEMPDIFSSDNSTIHQKRSAAWQNRASGTSTHMLSAIRDQIFELIPVKSDSLILDGNASTGLLTFEACRRANQGSVLSLCLDERSYETVIDMAKSFSPLQKPQVIKTTIETFSSDLTSVFEKPLSCDAIVARSMLSFTTQKIRVIQELIGFLAHGAVMVLVEQSHQFSQRISELIMGMEAELHDLLQHAEQNLFSDATDPFMNWTPESLTKEIAALNGVESRCFTLDFSVKRRVMSTDIEYWFRQSMPTQRKSLGDHIRARATAKEHEAVRSAFHHHLERREVVWKNHLFFMVMRRT